MTKEKTLNDKMMTPYRAVRKFEEEWDNNKPELKCVFDSEDVKQKFKKILDKIRRLEGGINKEEGELDLKVWMSDVIKIIKQESGFEDLE